MTEKLTTAEVRLAATTNEDLPLTQYKKLESGFDAWLESVKAEAVMKALGAITPERSSTEKTQRLNRDGTQINPDRPSRRQRRITRELRKQAQAQIVTVD